MDRMLQSVTIGERILEVPVIQGGMGIGVSRSRLAGAVAREGGMGVISCRLYTSTFLRIWDLWTELRIRTAWKSISCAIKMCIRDRITAVLRGHHHKKLNTKAVDSRCE